MKANNLHRRLVLGLAVFGLTGSAVSGPAFAEDEAERRFKAKNQLVKAAGKAAEKCGGQLKVELAYDRFDKRARQRYAIASWCEHVLDQLRGLCRGPKTKAIVQRRIKRFRCMPASKDGRNLTIADGTVTLFIDFEAANYGQFARRALVRKL